MSMDATEMKNAVISKMAKEAGSANAANKKFGDAILEYIIDKMDITYSWYGYNSSSGATDPVVTFKAVLSGSGTLSPAATFKDFLVKLAAFIKQSITISPASGFSIGGLEYNPSGVIDITMNKEDDPDGAMRSFCSQLITSLKSSFPNPAQKSGSHAAFSGNTTGMVIA